MGESRSSPVVVRLCLPRTWRGRWHAQRDGGGAYRERHAHQDPLRHGDSAPPPSGTGEAQEGVELGAQHKTPSDPPSPRGRGRCAGNHVADSHGYASLIMHAFTHLVLIVTCFAVPVGCHAPAARESDQRTAFSHGTHNERHEMIWLPSLEDESKRRSTLSGFPIAEPGVLINEIGEVLYVSDRPQIQTRDMHEALHTARMTLPDSDGFAMYFDGGHRVLPSFCSTSRLPREHISFAPKGGFVSGKFALRRFQSRIPKRTGWVMLDECLNQVEFVDDHDRTGIMFSSTTRIPGIEIVFDLYEDRYRFRHTCGLLSEPFWMTQSTPQLTRYHGLISVFLNSDLSQTAWYDPELDRMIHSGGMVAAATPSLIVESTKAGVVITDRSRSFSASLPEGKRVIGSTEADLILCNDAATRGLNRGPVYAYRVLDGVLVPHELNSLERIERVHHQRWVVGRDEQGLVHLFDSELKRRMTFASPAYPYYVTREGTVVVGEYDGSTTRYRLVDRTGRTTREFDIDDLLMDSSP